MGKFCANLCGHCVELGCYSGTERKTQVLWRVHSTAYVRADLRCHCLLLDFQWNSKERVLVFKLCILQRRSVRTCAVAAYLWDVPAGLKKKKDTNVWSVSPCESVSSLRSSRSAVELKGNSLVECVVVQRKSLRLYSLLHNSLVECEYYSVGPCKSV